MRVCRSKHHLRRRRFHWSSRLLRLPSRTSRNRRYLPVRSHFLSLRTHLTPASRSRKNTYTPATVTPVGAIVGGVLGALAFVALAVAFYFLARRRARRLKSLPSRSTSPEFETLEAGDGVRRAGTFNLGSVAFTEPSMERLREMDHPPVYVHKRNTITGATIPTTPEEDVEAYERRTAAGTEGAAVPATVEETAAGAETETRTTVA